MEFLNFVYLFKNKIDTILKSLPSCLKTCVSNPPNLGWQKICLTGDICLSAFLFLQQESFIWFLFLFKYPGCADYEDWFLMDPIFIYRFKWRLLNIDQLYVTFLWRKWEFKLFESLLLDLLRRFLKFLTESCTFIIYLEYLWYS